MGKDDRRGEQGEFRGDISRDSFEAAKRFSRVLMQQGRVQLDADWNEQTSILLHHVRALAADLIGPHGGPGDGFRIENVALGDGSLLFTLAPGHYYVDGVLCEADADELVSIGSEGLEAGKRYVAFLDVWERHVSADEDDDIREVALGGSDTATRGQVAYQIELPHVEDEKVQRGLRSRDPIRFVESIRKDLMRTELPRLRARAKAEEATDPSPTTSASGYVGVENRLYRVEIHRGGVAWDKKPAEASSDDRPQAATVKWSRCNGSLVFPILALKGDSVTLARLGPVALRLAKGDCVEITDDDLARRGRPGELRHIKSIAPDGRTMTLGEPVAQAYESTSTKHPLLRRWDHSGAAGRQVGGAILVTETSGGDDDWIALEDGVQVQFQPARTGKSRYRAGDYWLIPARTATSDVLWPRKSAAGGDVAKAQPPNGVAHHYAPLAIIEIGKKSARVVRHLRRTFAPLARR